MRWLNGFVCIGKLIINRNQIKEKLFYGHFPFAPFFVLEISMDVSVNIEFLVPQAEVNFLGQLCHPNLVKLIGYCLEDEHRLLVYEFMPKGSLENHLFRSELLSHSEIFFFFLLAI